jgi:hypothetical protein
MSKINSLVLIGDYGCEILHRAIEISVVEGKSGEPQVVMKSVE